MPIKSLSEVITDMIQGGHGKCKSCWTAERREAMSKRMITLWTDAKKQEARERQKAYWREKKGMSDV